jgi:hypothetical protein
VRAGGVGGQPLLAMAGLDRPASDMVGRGGRRLHRSIFVTAGVALSWWRRQGAGWCVLVAPWWCSCAESRSVEVLRRCRGAACCLGRVRAAGMVLNRAKASTDAFVGGHDGGAFGRRSPCREHMVKHHVLSRAGLSGEDLVLLWTYDGGTLASCPSWRHRSLSPVPVEVCLVLQVAHLVRVAVVVQRVHGCLRS